MSTLKNLAIIAPECGLISHSLKEAFVSLGWSVTLLEYSPKKDSSPASRLHRFFDRDSYYEQACALEFNNLLRRDLRQLSETVDIEAILFLRGHKLDQDNKRLLQELRCGKTAWAIDSLERAPAQAEVFEFCDRVYVIDGSDVDRHHPLIQWMPLGVNENIYRPNGPKTLDVLAIGTLGPRYMSRQGQILDLCKSKSLEGWKVGFVGSTGNRLWDWQCSFGFRAQWIARRLSERDLAMRVASSRICVNILQDDGTRPVNPAFFFIAAAGSCQVVDERAYLAEWQRPYIDFIPFRKGRLQDTLKGLLSDPLLVERVASAGRLNVTANHTYLARAKRIMA